MPWSARASSSSPSSTRGWTGETGTAAKAKAAEAASPLGRGQDRQVRVGPRDDHDVEPGADTPPPRGGGVRGRLSRRGRRSREYGRGVGRGAQGRGGGPGGREGAP
ncbi:hypothetical protein THAOC_22178, partial [Thalassiosira oceanica]